MAVPAQRKSIFDEFFRDFPLGYSIKPLHGDTLPAASQIKVELKDVALLLDSIPEDIPVLIDEAYHHFVEDPEYATSVPYVKEGRNVIIARTFSKIAALAGMRLGYAVAPRSLLQQLRRAGRLPDFDSRELVLQDVLDSVAHKRVVVSDEDSRHVPPIKSGIRTFTTVPASSCRRMVTLPPHWAARSLIPRRPSESIPASADSEIPQPLSRTSNVSPPFAIVSRTRIAVAWAWRATLVSIS